MFGRKEEPKAPATKQDYEEDDDLDDLIEEDDRKPVEKKSEPSKLAPKEEVANEAMIVSGQLVGENLWEYVIRSNYPLGHIGAKV
jgi:hypothetical protein